MSTQNLYSPLANGQVLLAVPFDIINRDYISVRTRPHYLATEQLTFIGLELVEGSDYTWISDGQIQLTVPANGNTDYLVERVTPRNPLTVFQAGAFSSARANLNATQTEHTQEEQDDKFAGIYTSLGSTLRSPGGAPLRALPSNRNGHFLAFDADGQAVNGTPTGSDSTLRADIALGSGAALVGFRRPELGGMTRSVASGFLDLWVNVKDFGALGDGVADDSLEIQNAIDAAAAMSQQDGTFYQTPVTVYFPSGTYRASGLKVIEANISFEGNAAVIQLADPLSYILYYSPWNGGFQAYKMRGLTFDGGVLDYLTDTYGYDFDDMAENAILNIGWGGFENCGVISGSNNIDYSECLFTRLGCGVFYVSGERTFFGAAGFGLSFSGSIRHCGFRWNLYAIACYATAGGSYVGNIEVSNNYFSTNLKGLMVAGSAGFNSLQKFKSINNTADTRGIGFILYNGQQCSDVNSRMEHNAGTIADTIDVSDIVPNTATTPSLSVPYRTGGLRNSHVLYRTDMEVINPHIGTHPHLRAGSLLSGQFATTGDPAAIVDDLSSVTAELFGVNGVQGYRARFATETAPTVILNKPVAKMPSYGIGNASGVVRGSFELSKFKSVPTASYLNYVNHFNPYLSQVPAIGGTVPGFALADDGVIARRCLEITGHGTAGWNFGTGVLPVDTEFELAFPDGYFVTMCCVKALSFDPFTLSGPLGFTANVTKQDVWQQFITYRKISDGISNSASWTCSAGSHNYRICNLAYVVLPTVSTLNDFLESNHFPAQVADVTGFDQHNWLDPNSIRGTMTWAASATNRYPVPGLVTSATARGELTGNEYVKTIWLRGTGAGMQTLNISSGLLDAHYGTAVDLSAGGWVKATENVAPPTGGTALQNKTVLFDPAAAATMDVEYVIEFGKLL